MKNSLSGSLSFGNMAAMHVFCHKAITRIMQYDSVRIQKRLEFLRKFQRYKKKNCFFSEHKKHEAFIEILWV